MASAAHAAEDAAHVLDYLFGDHYQPLDLDSEPPSGFGAPLHVLLLPNTPITLDVEGIFGHDGSTSHSLDDIIMETVSREDEESKDDDGRGGKQQGDGGDDRNGEEDTQEEKTVLGDSTGDTGNHDDNRDETADDKCDTLNPDDDQEKNDTEDDGGGTKSPADNRDQNNNQDGKGDANGPNDNRDQNGKEDDTGDTDAPNDNRDQNDNEDVKDDTDGSNDNRDQNDNEDDEDDASIHEDDGDKSSVGEDANMEVTGYGEEEADFGWHVRCRAVRVEMLFGDDEVARIDSFVWKKSKKSYRREGVDRRRRYNLRKHVLRSMGAEEARRHREFEKQCRKVSLTVKWGQKKVILRFDGQRKWRGQVGSIGFQTCFGGVELALLGRKAPVFISRG